MPACKRILWLFLLVCGGIFRVAAADLPRSETPQPQFSRSDWVSLNGAWDFAFDDTNSGLAGKWQNVPQNSHRTITVPYCFESKLSGIHETSFHPVAWYWRSLTIPRGWQGRHILLHFGAVDYRAQVWLNGQFLGAHEGGNVPFSFDITSALTRGVNRLTVRAEDPPTDRSIPRGKQYWEPKSKGIFYTRTSGIWQPVWMEATGEHHLQLVHVVAGQDGVAHFAGALEAIPGHALSVSIDILDGETVAGHATANTIEDRFQADISIPQAKLWSPVSPHLYSVRYRLSDGNTLFDQVESYIGFRSVAVKGGRVTINGAPVYLKFLLDQGYWPESVLTPPSDAAIQKDIDLIIGMGFNGVRKHQKVADPRFLYWADKRGLLVSGEMANAQVFDEAAVRRFTREYLDAIQRDFNHPSIIIWNGINESWGVPQLTNPLQQAYLKELYYITHAIDNTRLVIDNEGWQHTDQTDLFAIHDYEKSGEKLYQKYKDVTAESTSIPRNGREALIPGYKYNGSPLYLSEFGGIAYIPPGTVVPGESWGYSGVEKTPESALARLTGLYEGLEKLPNIVGICYTQLTDVEQEVNGLVTFDRKTKFALEKIKALNDKLQ